MPIVQNKKGSQFKLSICSKFKKPLKNDEQSFSNQVYERVFRLLYEDEELNVRYKADIYNPIVWRRDYRDIYMRQK